MTYGTRVVPPQDGLLPGGKTGHNRTLIDPGPSDADNGKPDIRAGSPLLHYPGSGVGKTKKEGFLLDLPEVLTLFMIQIRLLSSTSHIVNAPHILVNLCPKVQPLQWATLELAFTAS